MDNWNWDYPRFLGYTYENMQNDLGIFARIFPEYLQVQSLGKSADLRKDRLYENRKTKCTTKGFYFWGNSRTGIYDLSAFNGAGGKISSAP